MISTAIYTEASNRSADLLKLTMSIAIHESMPTITSLILPSCIACPRGQREDKSQSGVNSSNMNIPQESE